MKPVKPMIVLAIVVVVGAASGYGGWMYRGTKIPTRGAGNFAQGAGVGAGNFAQGAGARGAGTGAGAGMAGRGGAAGGRVTGQIISADAKSVTVKLADGSSKIVLISDQTTINKAAQGTITDLTSGTTVSVFGSTNSDGSVTAQNVQINPVMPGASPAGK